MKIFLITISTLLSFYVAAENWSLVHEEQGIKVYAGEYQKSGVIPFKALGVVNAPIHKVAELIENDQLKPEWSPKLKSVIIHERISKDELIFSEYYSTPWPAVDREFLLRGKIKRHSDEFIEYIGESIDNHYKDADHIQALVKKLNFSLKKVDENRTHITFVFNGDMKGWMPIWLMNLIQKKWPLRFIQGLRQQLGEH